MKSSKLIEFFKDGNIVIPLYFFKKLDELKISSEEFLFLMYLYNQGNNFVFDVEKYSEELNMDIYKIMEIVDNLNQSKLVDLVVSKDESGIRQEVLSLDGFYNKISLITMDEVVQEENVSIEDSTVFEFTEQEFGRTLSTTEFETIKAWLLNGTSEELIKEAVKEAIFNGVTNMRYIDKILYEWSKNNITTVSDVEKNRVRHKEEKENIDKDVDMDIVEWDWLDE